MVPNPLNTEKAASAETEPHEKSGNFLRRLFSSFSKASKPQQSTVFSVGTKGNEHDTDCIDDDDDDDSVSIQITELQSKVNELENELKKYKEALARSHADIMNIQNMNKKDVENARKFATKSFSKDMLNVADSLSGCLNVVDSQPGGEEHASAEHIKSVIDGVRVTQHALMDTFDRHGIKKIESMNAEFDPNFHEALFKMPTNDFAPDTVCQVISEGYTIKDAVLRAAKVGVSTPLPTPPSEENTTEESETNADSDEKKE